MTVQTGLEYGDAQVAYANEILRTTVGSGVHGLAIAGTDDHDEMGVYVEPPEYLFSISSPRDNYVWRTQPEGARSGPGDTDRVLYSLRKYLQLATKGNPTALLPLFAPGADVVISTALGDELRQMRTDFLSVAAVHRFLGYMAGQRERMMGGGRRSAVPNRPELIAKYGWDVKYGSHALRLAYEGLEIVTSGTLTLPIPEPVRSRVLAVKTGAWTRDQTARAIEDIEAEILARLKSGQHPLRPAVDIDRITQWSAEAHRRHWGW